MERDPITRFQLFLIREGILDEQSIGELEKSVDEEVQQAADQALSAAIPAADSYTKHVYSAVLDPTSSAFETKPDYELAAEGKLRAAWKRPWRT